MGSNSIYIFKKTQLWGSLIIVLFSEKVEREKREKRETLSDSEAFSQFFVSENGFPLEVLLPALLHGFVLGPPVGESWITKEEQNPENLPHECFKFWPSLPIHLLFSVLRQLPFVVCSNGRERSAAVTYFILASTYV